MLTIRLALILGSIIFSASAVAAGVDSRGYSCGALHNLISGSGFVYLNNPSFADFVVANASYCGGGGSAQVQFRSVPTTDTPECLVNYCSSKDTMGGGGMGGGGM